MNRRIIMSVGATLGLLAVALGAFGAHALRAMFVSFPERRAIWETAVHYHMFHTLALFLVVHVNAALGDGAVRWAHRAAVCFVAGIVLFSGSLYLLGVGMPRSLGLITPVGGVLFLAGWACLIRTATVR